MFRFGTLKDRGKERLVKENIHYLSEKTSIRPQNQFMGVYKEPGSSSAAFQRK